MMKKSRSVSGSSVIPWTDIPNAELAQKLYDTRSNLRESIHFYPLTITQEATDTLPLYRRVVHKVEEFNEMLECWKLLGLIMTEVSPEETAEALKKVVKF